MNRFLSLPLSLSPSLPLSLVLLQVATPTWATMPNPKADLEVKLSFYKPGCDTEDYSFFIKNEGTTHEYRVKRSGTAKVDNGPTSCCEPGAACCNEYAAVPNFNVTECLGAPNLGSTCQIDPVSQDPIGCCLVQPEIPCESTYNDDAVLELSIASPGTSDCDPGVNTNDANVFCGNGSAFSGCPPLDCDSNLTPADDCTCDNTVCDSTAWCSTIDNAKVEVLSYRDGTAAPPGPWINFNPPIVVCEGFNMFSLPDAKRVPPYCPVASSCVLSASPEIPSCD